jgi:serine/threonine protein kinase
VYTRTHVDLPEIDLDEVKVTGVCGKGAFGEVRRGVWRGAQVVVKELSGLHEVSSAEDLARLRETFRNEAMLMKQAGRHPRVLTLVGVCVDRLALVSEYKARGSMEDVLRRGAPEFGLLLRMLLDAASGVLHLHSEGVIHRDIALRNMLVDQSFRVVVTDFVGVFLCV